MQKNSYRKNFVALAAPSGGGKSTLCDMLLKKYSELTLSISFTTRPPRGAEKNGVEYNFASRAEFEQLIQTKQLVEWAEVHGNYYGTSRTFLDRQCEQGKVVILDIDVQGVRSLKKIYGERCLAIFLLPPDMQVLEQRLRKRSTETEEKIQQRLKAAESEIRSASEFDAQIVNEDLQATFEKLCTILESEVGLAH